MPFQRDSVELSSHGKLWQDVAADQIREDDILAGVNAGKVRAVKRSARAGSDVYVWAGESEVYKKYQHDQQVRLFGPAR